MAAPTDEMSCKELVEVITQYLHGVLPRAERQRFEEHLAQCPGCQTYLEQMNQTIRTLGHLSEQSIPLEAKQELLRVFRNWKQGA
jgi:anti-sigma factor RsiW